MVLAHRVVSSWRSRKKVLDRSAALLTALLLFNYSILSSANCKSFCNLNKIYENAYTELLIIEDDSGNSLVLTDSFCEVDTGSDDESESEGGTGCEHCAYCNASSTGMAFQHMPPLVLEPAITVNKEILNRGRTFLNKQISLNHPQRAPPLPV